MLRLKTTELGGHPLTLNDFGYLQGSIMEGLKAFINSMVGNKPCILWGIVPEPPMNIGGSNFQWELSDGLYWDGEELLFHTINYQVTTASGNPTGTWRLEKAVNNSVLPPLVYRNGQTKHVYLDGYCASNMNGSTGMVLDTIVRLDDELKARLGIVTLNSLMTTLSTNVSNLITGHNQQEFKINALDQQLSNHIIPGGGGHPWGDISNKPYLHGSAYLGDIGVTSPAFPHVMGTNCRRVAGSSSDSLYEIKLPNAVNISGAYHVYGSIVGVKGGWGAGNYQGVLWDDCNDITFSIVRKQVNQFHLAVRELNTIVQDLWFEFMVVDISKL